MWWGGERCVGRGLSGKEGVIMQGGVVLGLGGERGV